MRVLALGYLVPPIMPRPWSLLAPLQSSSARHCRPGRTRSVRKRPKIFRNCRPTFRPLHRPGWRYPAGYAYRRWTSGLLLPHLFLSSNYYFNDYATYGFGPPPYGCRWVRYGPDLLLVETRTGRIRDVVYGAFD